MKKDITNKTEPKYHLWVKQEVKKFSNKPFKSGKKIGIIKGLTLNENSHKTAFIMDDDSVVDCFRCELINKNYEKFISLN
jgi:hypothetical protein